jgi:hypothetical protein
VNESRMINLRGNFAQTTVIIENRPVERTSIIQHEKLNRDTL